MLAIKQNQNEFLTLILTQIGDISSKWNHASMHKGKQNTDNFRKQTLRPFSSEVQI